MDATRFSSRKLAILITLSLLFVAASSQAYAQTTTFSVPANVAVPTLGSSASIQVSMVDGSTHPFTATVSYPNGGSQWLTLSNFTCQTSVSGTTPMSITLAEGCSPNGLSIKQALITFAVTDSSGIANTTTTASLSAAGGTLTATGSSGGSGALNLSAPVSSSTQGYVTVATTNLSPISFTVVPPTGASWLTAALSTGGLTGSVSNGVPATLNVTASSASLGAGTYTATIQINYANTSTPVLVTFTVGGTGGGNGTLSPSQTSIQWSFNTGGTAISTPVSINTPAGNYTATIQNNITPSGVYWLALSSTTMSGSTSVTGPGNSLLTIASTSNLLTLATGSYTAPILITDSNGNSTFIYVYLTVNGGSSTITASQNPITLSTAYGSSAQVQTTVTITSQVAGTLTASVSGTGLSSVSPSSSAIAAGGSVQLTIFGNGSGLAQNTYSGTLTATVNSTTQNFPISFVVGSGTTGNTSSSVAPSTLQFNYQTDGTSGTPPAQQVMIGGSASFNITTTQNNTVGSLTWLSVTPTSGTAPQMAFVNVNPAGLTAGTYSGSATVAFSDGTQQTFTVNLTVMTGSPLVYAQPGTVIINQQTGTLQNSVYLYSTNGSTVPLTVSQPTSSWASIVSTLPLTSQTSFAVQSITTNLSNGMNVANITVNYGTAVLTIPVVAYVTNGTGGGGNGTLTFNPSSITLNAQAGTTTAVSTNMTFTSSSSTPTAVTVTSTEATCTQTTWLSLNGFTGTFVYAGYNAPITVSASPFGLPAGTCTGSILFTVNGVTQTVPVTFTIGGGITLSTSSMSFAYTSGGATPAAQTFTVTNSSGAAINYTAAATTTSGGTWLSVSPISGTTGTTGALSVSVNPSSLSAGTYTGTIAVTPTSGSASNITVTLTVTTPSVTASPTNLSFTYQAGGSTPTAQNITVSGGPFTASASSTGNWLSVSPASGTTGATVSASVNPSGLAAGVYNGTITVAGSGGATGSTTVSVTLTVTAPLPTVTAVVNAASFGGGPISPGEIISIGGSGLGPASPAFLTLDSNGNVTTSIGGVTVTIGGFAAPLTYASSTQINAIVPYEVAGQIAPVLVVKYLGQTSNGVSLQAAATAPGVFTQNASGTGPGAILNQDYSVNGPGRPAAKGTVVQVFMTGEGKTSPTAVTGKVNNVSNPSQLPVPLVQPVSAMVGGQPAQVVFAAEAPGAVSGLLQVNLIIPSTVASGTQPIVISVGTSASQGGVTVTVQ